MAIFLPIVKFLQFIFTPFDLLECNIIHLADWLISIIENLTDKGLNIQCRQLVRKRCQTTMDGRSDSKNFYFNCSRFSTLVIN